MNYYQVFSGFYKGLGKGQCLDCRDFIKKNSKILDLGCGSGITAKIFQDFFQAEVTGVDVKDARIFPIPFKIIESNSSLPFPDNSFDAVFISFVLHHTKEPEHILREARRITRDKILIYEDLPEGILSKSVCQFHGLTFNLFFQKNKGTSNFKNTEEWKGIFNDLNLKLIFEKKTSFYLNPVKKKLFVLQKV